MRTGRRTLDDAFGTTIRPRRIGAAGDASDLEATSEAGRSIRAQSSPFKTRQRAFQQMFARPVDEAGKGASAGAIPRLAGRGAVPIRCAQHGRCRRAVHVNSPQKAACVVALDQMDDGFAPRLSISPAPCQESRRPNQIAQREMFGRLEQLAESANAVSKAWPRWCGNEINLGCPPAQAS